ncbi:MAG: GIY-YIG nuclease family protein [Candidatus Dojkabacteria bacterium]|nr:GIY-YIG nuclease family protein [Candidatus Dojkabacteria bacterium]
MYFVYILYSKEIDRDYVGQTYDVGLRLERHALKTTRYTKQANDWELKYTEEYKTRSEAMKREKEIKKKKSRSYIEFLIQSSAD